MCSAWRFCFSVYLVFSPRGIVRPSIRFVWSGNICSSPLPESRGRPEARGFRADSDRAVILLQVQAPAVATAPLPGGGPAGEELVEQAVELLAKPVERLEAAVGGQRPVPGRRRRSAGGLGLPLLA